MTYTPSKTVAWAQQVAAAVEDQLPEAILEGPLRVDVVAVMPRPKRLLRKRDPDGLIWHDRKPDRDNLDKAILDALACVWRDDAQICDGRILKVYAERDGRPRMVVRIRDGLQEDADAAYRAVTL